VELGTYSDPRIYRELRVLSNITCHKFHKILQIAFGWEDEHLYVFNVYATWNDDEGVGRRMLVATIQDLGSTKEVQYCREDNPQMEHGTHELWTSSSRLTRLFKDVSSDATDIELVYEYDMGDGWEHKVTFNGIADPEKDYTEQELRDGVKVGQHSYCFAGEGHGCHEDAGGPYSWDNKRWKLVKRGLLDIWHWDVVQVNRRLDHMWVKMTPTNDRRLWKDIIGAWFTDVEARSLESRQRMEDIAQDAELFRALHEEAKR